MVEGRAGCGLLSTGCQSVCGEAHGLKTICQCWQVVLSSLDDSPTSVTVPGGVAFLTSSFDSENACFQPDISNGSPRLRSRDRTVDYSSSDRSVTTSGRYSKCREGIGPGYLPFSPGWSRPMGHQGLCGTAQRRATLLYLHPRDPTALLLD